MHVIDTN